MDSLDDELFPSLGLESHTGDDGGNMSNQMMSLLSYLGCDRSIETSRSSHLNMFPSSLTDLHARATANLISQTQEAIMQEYNITDMDVVHDNVTLDTINEIFSNDDYSLADISLLNGLGSDDCDQHEIPTEDGSNCEKITQDKLDIRCNSEIVNCASEKSSQEHVYSKQSNSNCFVSSAMDPSTCDIEANNEINDISQLTCVKQQPKSNPEPMTGSASIFLPSNCVLKKSDNCSSSQTYPDFVNSVLVQTKETDKGCELEETLHVKNNEKENKLLQHNDDEEDGKVLHDECNIDETLKNGNSNDDLQDLSTDFVGDEHNTESLRTVDDKKISSNSRSTFESLFTCPHTDCKRKFRYTSHFKYHLQTHVGTRHCKCDCGKTFFTPQQLEVHRRVHTGTRPFSCSHCDKTFTTAGNLKNHTRLHSGERPYQCDECGKSFTEVSSLKKHKLTHSGEKPFKCLVCGKGFTQSSSRAYHMKRHKNVEGESTPS